MRENYFFICIIVLLLKTNYNVGQKQSICKESNDYRYLVNCSGRNLATIPRKRFYGMTLIKYLDFSHNSLQTLNDKSFRQFSRIETLLLDYNSIKGLTVGCLKTIGRYLTRLSLRGNLISLNHSQKDKSSVNFLIHLKVLEELDLSENPLEVLPSSFLKPVQITLRILHIDSLSKHLRIADNAFYGLSGVTHFYARNNKFIEFRATSLTGLKPENFMRYSIAGTEFNCDCLLAWYHKWYERIQLKSFNSIYDAGICTRPRIVQNQPIRRLHISSYQCQPYLIQTNPPLAKGSSNPSHINVQGQANGNISLACTFISRPKLFIRWYKDGALIQAHWPNAHMTISEGVEFTTTLNVKHLRRTDDQSIFQCTCANNRGSAQASFILYIINASYWPNRLAKFYNYENQTMQETTSFYDYFKLSKFSLSWQTLFIIICLTAMLCIFVGFLSFYVCFKFCVHNSNRKNIQKVNVLSEDSLSTQTKSQNNQYHRHIYTNNFVQNDLLEPVAEQECLRPKENNIVKLINLQPCVGRRRADNDSISVCTSVDSDCPLHSLTGKLNCRLTSDCPVHGFQPSSNGNFKVDTAPCPVHDMMYE